MSRKDMKGMMSLGHCPDGMRKAFQFILSPGTEDALQLSDEHVTVLLTRKGISQMDAMTPEAVMEKYQITPSQVIDMKALMGDASDNIPGVRGVGEKQR